MRKVIIGAMVSLDGVMQAPGGPDEDPTGGFRLGGWVAPHWDDVLGAALDEAFAQPFDLLLGRRTYDIFAAFWPYVQHDPAAGGHGPTAGGVRRVARSRTANRSTHAALGDVEPDARRDFDRLSHPKPHRTPPYPSVCHILSGHRALYVTGTALGPAVVV